MRTIALVLVLLAGCGGDDDGGELGGGPDGGSPTAMAGGAAPSESERVTTGAVWACACASGAVGPIGPSGPAEVEVCSASHAFALRQATKSSGSADCECCLTEARCRREIEDSCEQAAGSILCADARDKSCPAD